MKIEVLGEGSPTPTVTTELGHASAMLILETEHNSQTYTVNTPEGRISLTVSTSESQASIILSLDGVNYLDTTQNRLKQALQALGDQVKLLAIIQNALAT